MQSKPEILRERTKRLAIRIVKLFRILPATEEARVIGRQVLRSGTSVGANYRAVCRARSRAEFTARMGVVIEEADETVFWLEMLIDCGVLPRERLAGLLNEADELVRIFAASRRTAQSALQRRAHRTAT